MSSMPDQQAGQSTKNLFAKQAALLCAEQAKGACAEWFKRQGQYRSGLAACIVTLTETEKAGVFSRRCLAEGVHICDGREYWVPVNDTEVEWSFPTVTSPTAHAEWTVSQILTYLEVLVPNDDQLRKCAEPCVGKCNCGDVACTGEGFR